MASKSKRGVIKQIYLLPILLLWGLALLFIYAQHNSEKEHKAEELNAQLQLLNRFLLEDLNQGRSPDEMLDGFTLPAGEVRITLIDLEGKVLFDNLADPQQMENHLGRPEVIEAMCKGSGTTICRLSSTKEMQYFYSATMGRNYIVRTALPYTVTLKKTLQSNSLLWWLVIGLTTLISLVIALLARAIRQRDRHYQRILEQEEEKVRLKRQLTNNINHELKTPVASIQVCLETLINNPNLAPEQQTRLIDRCYQSCQRLRNLLRDVSLITRIEAGHSQIALERVSLNEIIEDLKAELEDYPAEKRLDVVTRIEEPVVLMGCQSLLISIFRNLTENAIAYSEGSKITIALEESNETGYKIVFEDDGVGVEEHHLAHLFERFYRVDKGRSRQTGGTGLGLAIVKHAVQFHGGTITAHNRPNGGLRFCFTLKKESRK